MGKQHLFNWQASLVRTYEELTTHVIEFLPQVLSAIVLLILGWGVAHLLRIMSYKLAKSLDFVFQRVSDANGTNTERIQRSYSVVFSKVVFWVVMAFFLAATTNMLGLNVFSKWLVTLITYLPNLLTGVLIILGGFLIGSGSRAGVLNTIHSTGIEQAELIARIVQFIIILTALIIGIEQIGINVGFITNGIIVVVGVVLAGAALAFGLGTQTLIANMVGAQYARKQIHIGEKMLMGDVEGIVVEVAPTSIILETSHGRVNVPAKSFHENVSCFESQEEPLDPGSANGI